MDNSVDRKGKETIFALECKKKVTWVKAGAITGTKKP